MKALALAIMFVALVVFAMDKDEESPLAFGSDGPLAFESDLWNLDVTYNLVFNIGGKDVVTIRSDGKVEYKGTPDEAAKAFWEAVEKHFPVCKECGKKR